MQTAAAVQTSAPAPDLKALKARQQAAWASGDYAVIGTTLQIVGEQLAEACDLRWDERVLDVAAGNGNATLAAARRGCQRDLHRLRRARCSTAAPSAPSAERPGRRRSRSPTPRRCRSTTRASTPCCRPSA